MLLSLIVLAIEKIHFFVQCHTSTIEFRECKDTYFFSLVPKYDHVITIFNSLLDNL